MLCIVRKGKFIIIVKLLVEENHIHILQGRFLNNFEQLEGWKPSCLFVWFFFLVLKKDAGPKQINTCINQLGKDLDN